MVIFDEMILKKLLSFIYPINLKTIPSKRSGVLEVTLVNGKLLLDSKKANYSFGSLQKVLKKGLLAIGKKDVQSYQDILILGVAAGSVIHTLRNNFSSNAKIIGIEIDQDVIELGKTYFDLDQDEKLQLIIADAFEYIAACTKTFDLIIIDIFNDTKMPNELFEGKFNLSINKCLNSNGAVLFNAIEQSQNKNYVQQINTLYNTVETVSAHRNLNTLYILKK